MKTWASGVRLAMELMVAAAAICWLMFFILQPFNNWEKKINASLQSSYFVSKVLNMSGSTFFLQVLPISVIAFLSYFIRELRRRLPKPSAKFGVRFQAEGKTIRLARSLWTLPIPIIMVTLGDLVFLSVIYLVTFGYFTANAVKYVNEIRDTPLMPGMPSRSQQRLGEIGVLFGNTAVIPMALLWIPVSRGSPILQVVGVPFERAVKYHTWLGYLTVLLLIAHGGALTAYFVCEHQARELITWETHGTSVAVPAGVVALAAGIIMMLTAIRPVRTRCFELFFAIHHLYPVFVVFFFLHAVGKVVYLIVPLLIFLMDRFMRAVQSRKTVEVLSAKVQESGIIELKFAKAANLTYHALSFVYVMLPSVSKLQWHPFSVASSPLDHTNKITIYIKPLGGFTKNLHDMLISSKSSKPGRDFFKCPFSCKLGVEGPYGDESAFYLRYKNLVMVAGGIGVTPFLAIFQDILHRYRLRQEDLPTSIQLVFCVKNASELHILDGLAPSSILPEYAEHLTITINGYVTSPASARDNTILPILSEETSDTEIYDPNVEIYRKSSVLSSQEMSPISSSGHSTWGAAIFYATIVGFFVINGIFNRTELQKGNLPNYVRVIFYIASFTISVLGCGGAVLVLWTLVERRARKTSQVISQLSTVPSPNHDVETSILPVDESLWNHDNVIRGRRPVWKDVFSDVARRHEGHDVGVLVSGAWQMQQDVALQCIQYNFSRASKVVMHYHSVSFEL